MRANECLLFTLAIMATACSGQVRTSRLEPGALDGHKSVSGVIVYQPTLVKLTHSFTSRVTSEGKVVGSATDGSCLRTIQKEEVVVLPDFSRPMLVSNASGWLSAAKFSVVLNNGMLVSINAEPTQKLSDVLTSASSLMTALGARSDATGGPVACNASAVLTAVSRLTLP